jgi:hypothetical protein
VLYTVIKRGKSTANTTVILSFFNVPYGLRGLPSGCGRSVTDFGGRDAHEAQLRCPDEVDGDI